MKKARIQYEDFAKRDVFMYRFVRFWLSFRIRKSKGFYALNGHDFHPEDAKHAAARAMVDLENCLRELAEKNGWLPKGYDKSKPIFGEKGLLNAMGNRR